MKFFHWADSKIKKLNLLDIGLIEWSSVAFGILLVILIPNLAEINIWWIVMVIILLAIKPAYKVFLQKE
jgi:hypothetical protein